MGRTNGATSTKVKGKTVVVKEYPQIGSPQYKVGQDFRDCFYSILTPAGNSYALTYSTLIGGNGYDNVSDLAIGPLGDVHLLWSTQSTDLTTTPNAVLASHPGNWSGYLMKIPGR